MACCLYSASRFRFPPAVRRLALIGLLFAFHCAVAATPSVTVPPLEFRERVLPNGLRVVSLEDHTSPTVSVQVWYMVGGRDDPEAHQTGVGDQSRRWVHVVPS